MKGSFLVVGVTLDSPRRNVPLEGRGHFGHLAVFVIVVLRKVLFEIRELNVLYTFLIFSDFNSSLFVLLVVH